MARRDITGERFGELVAVRPTGVLMHKVKSPQWMCVCDCGVEKLAAYNNLLSGTVKSCGCRAKRVASALGKTFRRHGHCGKKPSATYRAWQNMMTRCTDPNHGSHPDYGGRGITVCERWMSSFEAFLEDMGERPDGMSLDRKEVDKGYCKENCEWATRHHQARNTRKNVYLELDGRRMCVAEWAIELGVHVNTLRKRLKNGWDAKRVLTTTVTRRVGQ